MEPWQWPEAEWRRRVDQVRAGRSLKPDAWPGGKRCAVALSFDSDHETNELRDGGNSIGRMSWGEFGSRVGVPRILALLERTGIAATFFVPAVSALLHPQEQRAVLAAGHEIGLHGWIHEVNSMLPAATERDLHFRASDALEKITGVRPVGMRTPSWDFSPATLAIQRELGLLYDSSLMADDDPYELLEDGEPTGVVELPVEWIRVHDLPDYVYFNHSAHVNKGVGCTTCHGPVDKMSYVWQEKSLLMEWCLDCHRQPEKYLRPKSEVYSVAWKSPSNQLELGKKLAAEYEVRTQVTCSTCHR